MNWSYFSTLPKVYRIPLIVVGVAVLGATFFLVVGYLVMWLWNHALVTVLDVPPITFWQALGLFTLAKLFFGFGGGTQGGRPKHERHERRRGPPTVAGTEEPIPDIGDRFRQYWHEEGKHAYEAYLASKKSTGGSNEHP
jgi:hypothetical protein